ncbi:methionine adenosyltransferase [Massilia sp. TW-1]|uniref:Methionine adenosyltransferase n=1 Tax=Telluria antibiotica TaxID=2717319 RepID=A0ABX0PIA4_9BURK|nr:methionine adenosyltransferase [Telluria antibiotica]
MTFIVSYTADPVEARRTELCEHKGDGHPDSLCDGAADAVSQALCGAYLRAYGEVRHHNVDKALLIGGRSRPRFGGGVVDAPMRLIIAGCADPLPAPDDVVALARAAAHAYLERTLRHVTRRVPIEVAIRVGASQLRGTVAPSAGIPVANDTSFGAGHAPYSRLEEAVLDLSSLLRSADFRRAYPCAGDDFKVMGRRIDETIAVTIALAFVGREVAGVKEYFAQKSAMAQWLARRITFDCAIRINTLDAADATDESGIYLTVTGTSAEHGDDGQVGRGNRVNRLITPARTMSLEAAAGKNPVSHVGKLYNVLSLQMARALVNEVAELRDVEVQLLSAIGQPVNSPLLVALRCALRDGCAMPLDEARLQHIVEARLADIPALSLRLARGEVRVF